MSVCHATLTHVVSDKWCSRWLSGQILSTETVTETHDRDPVCLFSPTTALKSPDKSVQAYRLATRDIASTYLTLGLTEVGEMGFLGRDSGQHITASYLCLYLEISRDALLDPLLTRNTQSRENKKHPESANLHRLTLWGVFTLKSVLNFKTFVCSWKKHIIQVFVICSVEIHLNTLDIILNTVILYYLFWFISLKVDFVFQIDYSSSVTFI